VSGEIDKTLVEALRAMARDGRMPSEMFVAIKGRFGPSCHILDIIRYFREAFRLTLAEAKPLAGVSDYRGDTGREIVDVPLLDSLLLPAIHGRAPEWRAVAPATSRAERGAADDRGR
jgi:hypothetical protein